MSEVSPKVTVTVNEVTVNEKIEQKQEWETGTGLSTAVKYGPSWPELSLRSFRDEAEVHAISIALKQTGWNRKRAAQLLSISYRGLLYKIRRHNIAPPVEHT